MDGTDGREQQINEVVETFQNLESGPVAEYCPSSCVVKAYRRGSSGGLGLWPSPRVLRPRRWK